MIIKLTTLAALLMQIHVSNLQIKTIAPCFRKRFEKMDLHDPVVWFSIWEAYRPLDPLCEPPVSPKTILAGLKTNALHGDPKAMWAYGLAESYWSENRSPEGIADRLEWQEKAIAITMDPFWMFELSQTYYYDVHTKLNRRDRAKVLFFKAVPILEEMASKGNEKAIEILYYQPGPLDKDFDYDKKKWSKIAKQLRQKQLERKDPEALFSRADEMQMAACSEESMKAAINVFEEATEHGSWPSILRLALLYRDGYQRGLLTGGQGPILVRKNPEKYKYWIQQGTEATGCPQFEKLLDEGD